MRKFLTLFLCIFAFAAQANIFEENPNFENCQVFEKDFLAKSLCECAKIDNAVARLECFDEIKARAVLMQSQADLTVSSLAQSPFGRNALLKWFYEEYGITVQDILDRQD